MFYRTLVNIKYALIVFVGLLSFASSNTFGVMPSDGLSNESLDEVAWGVVVGDRAMERGVPSIADSFYAKALFYSLPKPEREAITLKRVSAYLAMDNFREAANLLLTLGDVERSDYYLRVAMVAYGQGQVARMRNYLGKCDVDALCPSDTFWYHFLVGVSAAQRGYTEEAKLSWEKARGLPTSLSEKAQLDAFEFKMELTPEVLIDPKTLEVLREKVLLYQGDPVGVEFVKSYAIALEEQGKRQDALELVQKQLEALPSSQREKRAYFLLLEGLLAGVSTEQGQVAFQQLLAMHGSKDLQRIALYALAGDQIGVQDSEAFQSFLDELIASGEKDMFAGELVLLRAYLALGQEDWGTVSKYAKAFIDQYPESTLKSEAFLLLAYAAWRNMPPQYRLTAEYLTRARELLPGGEERDILQVLVGDCYFLDGDYKKSASIYRGMLEQNDLSISRGAVLYQWALCELKQGAVDQVCKYLKDPSNTQRIEPYYRWRVEWNIVQTLRGEKRVQDAFARIEYLLENVQFKSIDPELRFRLLLLEAELSLDVGQVDKTPFLVDSILSTLKDLPSSTLSDQVRVSIATQSLLLKGDALVRQRAPERGLLVLQQLQEQYPNTQAAELSYLIEARYYALVDRRVDAQRKLIALADRYPQGKYAPIALYEAALNADARGLNATYDEALSILERLIKAYPQSPLVYSARMLQGDILRKMNEFGVAQLIYENLIYQYPNNEGRYRAMLARADCLFAGARSAGDWGEAIAAYERIYDMPDAPLDLRLESGYKWALALLKSGKDALAQDVYWELLVKYLIEGASKLSGDGKGRYWMARSVFELADLLDKNNKPEEAANVYTMILTYDLPGRRLAQAKLDKFKILTH